MNLCKKADNGLEFGYKALPKHKRTRKVHPFDKVCKKAKIQLRTIKFGHPWTNGMVENFKKRIRRKILTQYIFQSIFEMMDKLIEFVDDYNHNIRSKSLDYKTPAQYLKKEKNITLQSIVS